MKVRIQDHKDINEEAVTTTLRRALRFYSTIQAHDGHWPGDYGGPMFLMPGLVSPPTSFQVTQMVWLMQKERWLRRWHWRKLRRLFIFELVE